MDGSAPALHPGDRPRRPARPGRAPPHDRGAGAGRDRARRTSAPSWRPATAASPWTWRSTSTPPPLGASAWCSTSTRRACGASLAPARTFGFVGEVEALRAAGLAQGAGLHNAVAIDGGRVGQPRGPALPRRVRAPQDARRPWATSTCWGAPILGRYAARRPGHALNNALARALLAQPKAWRWRSWAPALAFAGLRPRARRVDLRGVWAVLKPPRWRTPAVGCRGKSGEAAARRDPSRPDPRSRLILPPPVPVPPPPRRAVASVRRPAAGRRLRPQGDRPPSRISPTRSARSSSCTPPARRSSTTTSGTTPPGTSTRWSASTRTRSGRGAPS